jgi:muramoyltetrapeptide carboxypeptidase
LIRTPRLQPGARVSLVAAAGPLGEGALERAMARVASLGWVPLPGRNAARRSGYLAGTDDERAEDLQAALNSDVNDAIWLLRGGYGTMRILPRLDFAPLAERPRALIGFSDNTALHLAAQLQGVVSFHAPHPATTSLPRFSLDHLVRQLTDTEPLGLLQLPVDTPPPFTVAGGVATGRLVGGNLSLLAATVGTPYEVQADGAILFLEEVGEPVYRVDRMLSQLLLAGKLDGVAGVALGAFSECPDAGRPGLPTTIEVVADRLEQLGVPVAFGFPFGHIDESWTLPLGVRARLDASQGTLQLLESAVV